MKQYRDVCNKIIQSGRLSTNRTGVDTLSIFGCELRFDLVKEFPAITCKRAFVRGAVAELNWMLSGSTSVLDLHKSKVYFWDQWAIKGEHVVDKSINELKRDFYAKCDECWEHEIAYSKETASESPERVICDEYNIDMTQIVDDRFIYRAGNINDVVTFMIGKSTPSINNGEPITKEQAKNIIFSKWSILSEQLNSSKEVSNAILDYAEDTFGGFYAPYTQSNLRIALIDELDVTREKAESMIGHAPLAQVAKKYNIPRLVKVQTCEVGDLGPVYGFNWRHWDNGEHGEIDQITDLVKNLKHNPMSRRHVLSFWNPAHLPDERFTPQENVARGKMALAPCHWMCEFKVDYYTQRELLDLLKDKNIRPHFGLVENWTFESIQKLAVSKGINLGKLNIHPHMRSWDFPAGAPVNLAFYAAFCHMLAQQCGYDVGELWYTGSDVHMYVDQVEIMKTILENEARCAPEFKLTEHPDDIFGYSDNCYELIGYNPHPTVKVPVAL